MYLLYGESEIKDLSFKIINIKSFRCVNIGDIIGLVNWRWKKVFDFVIGLVLKVGRNELVESIKIMFFNYLVILNFSGFDFFLWEVF